MPGIKLLDEALDPGHASLLEIPNAEGLLSAAQMNTLEFHTWNGVATSIAKPDRRIFDLDPGDKVTWPKPFRKNLWRKVVRKIAWPGLGVSVPIAWDEFQELSSSAYWTVENIAERIAIGNSVWEDYAKSARSMDKAMKILAKKALE